MTLLARLGITPKTPLGCRATLGRQPPDRLGQGYPIAKDRFHLMSVRAESAQTSTGRKQQYLTVAPGFEAFNDDPFLAIEQWDNDKTRAQFLTAIARCPDAKVRDYLLAAGKWDGTTQPDDRQITAMIAAFKTAMEAHRKPRRTLHGVMVYSAALAPIRRGNGALWLRRAAQAGKAGGIALVPHPKHAPSCISEDGITARRWNGDEYRDTPCKGDQCPFFAENTGEGGKGQACQKHATIAFQLRWPNAPAGRQMPAVLCELDTSGTYNHAADALTGLIMDVDRQWRALNLSDEPDYFGLPFLLRLVHVTKPGANGQAGRAYWTVEAVIDLPTGMTLQEWAIGKARMLAEGRQLLIDGAPVTPATSGARDLYLEARDLPEHAQIPA